MNETDLLLIQQKLVAIEEHNLDETNRAIGGQRFRALILFVGFVITAYVIGLGSFPRVNPCELFLLGVVIMLGTPLMALAVLTKKVDGLVAVDPSDWKRDNLSDFYREYHAVVAHNVSQATRLLAEVTSHVRIGMCLMIILVLWTLCFTN